MGLIIVLLACIAIFVFTNWLEKEEGTNRICSIVELIAVLGGGCIILFFLLVPYGDDSLSFKYNKEELKEFIQLEELAPNDVFVNYSYSTKEYSYKISTNTKEAEICTIGTESSIIREVISEGEEIRIEHYKLTEPESFWIRHIPWIKADEYIIYVPEKDMISRTN